MLHRAKISSARETRFVVELFFAGWPLQSAIPSRHYAASLPVMDPVVFSTRKRSVSQLFFSLTFRQRIPAAESRFARDTIRERGMRGNRKFSFRVPPALQCDKMITWSWRSWALALSSATHRDPSQISFRAGQKAMPSVRRHRRK